MGASVETVSHNAKEELLTLYIPEKKPEPLLWFKMLPWFHRSLIEKSDLLLGKLSIVSFNKCGTAGSLN